MKNLPLKNIHFQYLLKSFSEWLDIIGYSGATIFSWPIHIREFLYWLEQQKIGSINAIKREDTRKFINYLHSRKNHRTGAGLSGNHINKIIVAVNVFGSYLNKVKGEPVELQPSKISQTNTFRSILTPTEINQIYEATFEGDYKNTLAFGQRDRAMLAIFYGCGIRKREGTLLDIGDIDLNRAIVLVREGKGRKEREVPIAYKNLADLEHYILEGREWFLETHKSATAKPQPKNEYLETALFIGEKGNRLEYGYYARLKILKERAQIEKPIGLHTLRHSIATHLLVSGMDIEEIRKFLGHSSLESTQIYTHLAYQTGTSCHGELVEPR